MKPVVGLAFCGSFCTFRKTIDTLTLLTERFEIVPIFSGSKPRFLASLRMRRTARWASSHAD